MTIYDWAQSRAIIDIGSNTVRLVVYGGPPRAPVTLLNEKVTARLGKHVAETGKLSDKAVESVLTALRRYRALLDLAQVPRVDVVATAAARDATNGPEFLARIQAIGFAPRLLSGVEEAETSATGVLGAFPGASGIVGDLGGGSLELVDIADGGTSHGVSLPLGSLRLPLLRARGDRVFVREISRMLAGADWAAEPEATLYLVGGSMRALGRAMMVQLGWPMDDTHGFALDAAKALELARKFARRGQVLAQIDGVSASRAASIPDAAALLVLLLQKLEPKGIVFSSWGLREGILFGSLPDEMQRQDPLLAGVSAFVEPMGVDTALVEATVTAIKEVAPRASSAVGRSAIMLCLAAGRIEPNLRRELPMEWGLQKRWVGVDNAGRAALASALRASLGKGGAGLVPWSDLAPQDLLFDARTLGHATRLCRRLSAGSARVLEKVRLRIANGTVAIESVDPDLIGDAATRDLRDLVQHVGSTGT